jgi:hypothetical protein
MMQVSPPKPGLPLRRTRSVQLRPPFVQDRRQVPPWWVLAAVVAVPLAVLAVLAYVGRRSQLEDAAEDLAEAAKEAAE